MKEVIELVREALDKFSPVERKLAVNVLARAIGVEPTPTTPASPVEPFTDEESIAFEHTVIPFGMHNGKLYGHVPLTYLEWLADASRATWRDLHRYLNSPRILRERRG